MRSGSSRDIFAEPRVGGDAGMWANIFLKFNLDDEDAMWPFFLRLSRLEVWNEEVFSISVRWEFLAVAAVWKNCTETLLSRRGNSCQLLECSCENKQDWGCAHGPTAYEITLFFNLSQAGRSENSKHCGGWLTGPVLGRKVNQSNVSSRSRELSPSPQSACVRQPLRHKTCVQGKVTGAGPS